MARSEKLCNGCGFPTRRGAVPIIYPGNEGACKAYCSVACFEKVAGARIPEPMRSRILAVESAR